MMRVGLLLGVLWAAASPALAGPVVTSASDCPTAAEIAARLQGLWSSDKPTSIAAHVRIEGERLLVELVGENEPAATRSLPAEASCEARAQAAALIIAAWLDTRTADPLGLPVAPADRADEPQIATQSRKTPARAQPRLWLAAGASASLDAQGAGGVLSGDATWLRLAGRLGLQGRLSFPLPRELAVGSGTARWWRPVLALGLHLPITEEPWVLAMDAGPALGLLLVSGSGFDHNHTDQALSWGASGGLRFAHQRGRVAYWAELRAWLWPRAQSIREDVRGSAPRQTALPRIEGHLGLGLSLAVF